MALVVGFVMIRDDSAHFSHILPGEVLSHLQPRASASFIASQIPTDLHDSPQAQVTS